jgi:dienelactone hydrolase
MGERLCHLVRRNAARPELLLLLLALSFWGLATLREEPRRNSRFVQESVRIPAHSGRYTLAVTILRPRGSGPYGGIVLNHGVPLTARARAQESPALLIHTAAAFAQRGYVVIMPLRRGFGATGGEFAEDPGTCVNPDYRRGERAAAADVLAAYEFARKLPYVDASRMILAGQSAGGVAALHAAAQAPQGLVAVLAFAAGRGANPMHRGVPCAPEALAALFEELGTAIRVPVLLHYAENDLSFGPAASRLWFRRFNAGGVRAEYVLQPPFGTDGHYIFSQQAGIELWLPKVEHFLARHGIAFELIGQRT